MPLPDILQQIVATKESEVAAAKALTPESTLRQQVATLHASPLGTPRNFFAALTKPPRGTANIIAEIKKASPSAGILKADFDPRAIARQYLAAGADALSVLTDESYFAGTLAYLNAVKQTVPLPVLRKDFLIDPYQVWQSRAAGADAILLIAEILSDAQLLTLHTLAAQLQLTTLIEVHELDSLLRVRSTLGFPLPHGTLLGINNRDLRTFKTNLDTTAQLAALVNEKYIIVAESGIRNREDVQKMNAAGVRILLIGETLMRTGNVAQTMADLKALPQ